MSEQQHETKAADAANAPPARAALPPPRKVKPQPFNWTRSVMDEKTQHADRPDGAKPAPIDYRLMPSYFVPVLFAAKDWNVTPRRIRALLVAGRLAGRVQDNGYWEVVFPYSFTFGTRGPGLKRQQRPPGKPKNSERRAA